MASKELYSSMKHIMAKTKIVKFMMMTTMELHLIQDLAIPNSISSRGYQGSFAMLPQIPNNESRIR